MIRRALRHLRDFLVLIRWFHELLALFPFMALYAIMRALITRRGVACDLSGPRFVLVCAGVQSLMVPGFILNDIADREIDRVNRPKRWLVGNTLSVKSAWILFGVSTFVTVAVSTWISATIVTEWVIGSAVVYALSVAYNVSLKRSPLFGNITIAALAAAVPLVMKFVFQECLDSLADDRLNLLIYLYAALPFFFTIPRELSLDISDMEGDRSAGAHTFPIVAGVGAARIVVGAFLVLIVALSLILMGFFPYLIAPLVPMDILVVVYLVRFRKIHTRAEYIRNGKFLWATMILGGIGVTVASVT
jgi:4-hydroxybenzoate polyprenyltransferase